MKNQILLQNIKISPMAVAVLKRIVHPTELNLFIELMMDAMKLRRYREFSNPLFFRNSLHGKRLAEQVKVDGSYSKINLSISMAILKRMNILKRMGISNSWIIEESLFFAHKNNLFVK